MLKNEKKVVLKHDMLRLLGREFSSIDEQRFLNTCLVDNYQRVQFNRDEYYPVNIANYAEKQNISLGKAYTELLNYVQDFTKELRIPLQSGETWVTRLIYSYKYDQTNLTLKVRFNEEVIPYLSGEMIAGTFSTYDVRLDKVPSNRRYLMSELIQRNLWKFKYNESFTLSVSEIRSALNLKDTEYLVFADLTKGVIKKTLTDMAEITKIYLRAKKNRLGVTFWRLTEEEFYAKGN